MATKKIQKKFYAPGKPLGENDKCQPQCKIVLSTIAELSAANGGNPVDKDAIVAALSDGRLGKTVQPPARIFGFYRPRVIEAQLVMEVTQEVEVEVPDPPKKEKAETAPATEGEVKPEDGKSKVKGKKGAPVSVAA